MTANGEVEVLVIGPRAHEKKAVTEANIAAVLKRYPVVKTEISILNALSYGAKDESLSVVLLYLDYGNVGELALLQRLRERYPTTPVVCLPANAQLALLAYEERKTGLISKVLCPGFKWEKLQKYFSVEPLMVQA